MKQDTLPGFETPGGVDRPDGVAREPGPGTWSAAGSVEDPARFFSLSLHLFLIADLQGIIRRVNAAWTEVLGFDADALVGSSFFDLVHPDDLEQTRREAERLGRGVDTQRFENRYRRRDGGYRFLLWSATAVPAEGLIYAVAHDITERKHIEDELRHRAGLERVLLDISTDLLKSAATGLDGVMARTLETIGREYGADRGYLCLLDEDGHRASNSLQWRASGIEPQVDAPGCAGKRAAPALLSMLRERGLIAIPRLEDPPSFWRSGHDRFAARGVQSLILVPVDFEEHLYGFIELDSLRAPRRWTHDETRVLRFLGSLIGVALSRGRAEKRLQESHGELERIAHYDPLTQLPNRRLLIERLRQAIAMADRNGTMLGVCFLDLDGLKPVNDRHGHEVGDDLLASVAERLASGVRTGDTVARWGGDEFAILLNGIQDRAACCEVLEHLLDLVAQAYPLDGLRLSVTASIGVTLYPEDPGGEEGLLRQADQALYLAKQEGRNGYRFFHALRRTQGSFPPAGPS